MHKEFQKSKRKRDRWSSEILLNTKLEFCWKGRLRWAEPFLNIFTRSWISRKRIRTNIKISVAKCYLNKQHKLKKIMFWVKWKSFGPRETKSKLMNLSYKLKTNFTNITSKGNNLKGIKKWFCSTPTLRPYGTPWITFYSYKIQTYSLDGLNKLYYRYLKPSPEIIIRKPAE